MDDRIITGISHSVSKGSIRLDSVPNESGISGQIFKILGERKVLVDMIAQSNIEQGEVTSMTFTLPRAQLGKAQELLLPLCRKFGMGLYSKTSVAKISVVGTGMRYQHGVAARVFEALGRKGINIEFISTSEIRISVLVEEGDVKRALEVLHEEFDLGNVNNGG